MKTNKNTLKALYAKYLKAGLVVKEKDIRDFPGFVLYFFNTLYIKYGTGEVTACTSPGGIGRSAISFSVSKEFGGGWFRCSCESLLAHAYDISYGQDEKQKESVLDIFAGYYSSGARQPCAMPGLKPDLHIVSKPVETFLLVGLDQAFLAEKMKCAVYTDLLLFKSLLEKAPIPISKYEFSEQ